MCTVLKDGLNISHPISDGHKLVDIDNDGFLEAVLLNGNEFRVLENNGVGVFNNDTTFILNNTPTSPVSLVFERASLKKLIFKIYKELFL